MSLLSSPTLEQPSTSPDLKKEAIEGFQSHVTLLEQWRNLQSSFAIVEASLKSREVELESKEREIGDTAKKVENRRKRVESEEKSVSEMIERVEMREKLVREGFEVLELERNRIREHCRVIEERERRVEERCRAVEMAEMREKENEKKALELKAREAEMSKGFEARNRALELKEKKMKEVSKAKEAEMSKGFEARNRALVFKEKEVSEKMKVLELKERMMMKENKMSKGFEARNEALELKEKEVNEKMKVLLLKERMMMKGNEMSKGFEARNRVLELKEKEVNEKMKVLESKEKEVDEVSKGVDSRSRQIRGRCKELELKEKEVEKRLRAVELREKNVKEGIKVLELIEKDIHEQLEVKEKDINEQMQVLEGKEKLMNEQMKVLEVKKKHVHEQTKVLDVKKKLIDKQMEVLEAKKKHVHEQLEVKERHANDQMKVLELREKHVNEQMKVLEVKEKHVNKQMELREKQMNEGLTALELVVKQVDEFSKGLVQKCCQAMTVREEQMNECFQSLELKVKQIRERCQAVELKEKQLKRRCAVLDMREQKMNEHYHSLGAQELNAKHTCDNSNMLELKDIQACEVSVLKDKQINEECKVVGLREKELSETVNLQVETITSDNNLRVCDDGDETMILNLCKAMNGKALQMFLNERVNEHESMGEKVGNALKLSIDPPKLVLTAVDGFFPSSIKSGDMLHKTSVVRSSCVFLLEQLMIMKPIVSEAVRIEAVKVATGWREKLRAEGETDVVVLGFLLFLASYRLVSNFERDELRRLYRRIDHHRLASELCLKLGLTKAKTVNNNPPQRKIETCQPETLEVTSGSRVASSSITVSSDIQLLCRNMDLNGVTSYLINHAKERDSLHEKILDALRLAADPAKLVLDVTRRFHQFKLGIDLIDDCKACFMLLLVKLMTLQADLTPHVKDEARKFAAVWRDSLAELGNTPLENFSFLQFLATYKLARLFKTNELLSLFETILSDSKLCWLEQIPYLCNALELAEMIPGLIQSIIRRNEQVKAVRYICTLKMEYAIPPVPLLKTYLDIIRKRVEEICRKGNDNAQDDAANVELTALRDVLKCIIDFKLESNYSPAPLELRIKQLEKEMKEREITTNSIKKNPVEKVKKSHQNMNRTGEMCNHVRVEEEVEVKKTNRQSNSQDTKKRCPAPRLPPRQHKLPRLGPGPILRPHNPTRLLYGYPAQLHGSFTTLPAPYWIHAPGGYGYGYRASNHTAGTYPVNPYTR